jgi:hypothetical protein
MTLRNWNSGALSLLDIQNEFGDVRTTKLTDYYNGRRWVPNPTYGYPGGVKTQIPGDGTISIANFYGAQAYRAGTVYWDWDARATYPIIYRLPYYVTSISVRITAGGGGGGAGAAEGYDNGNVTVAGGGGGAGGTYANTITLPSKDYTANRLYGDGILLKLFIGAGGGGGQQNTGANQGTATRSGTDGGNSWINVYEIDDTTLNFQYDAIGGTGGGGGIIAGSRSGYPGYGGYGYGASSVRLGAAGVGSGTVGTYGISTNGGDRPQYGNGGNGGTSYPYGYTGGYAGGPGGAAGTGNGVTTGVQPGKAGFYGSGGGGGGANTSNRDDGYAQHGGSGGGGRISISW